MHLGLWVYAACKATTPVVVGVGDKQEMNYII
jgi:hypothetical protein